MARLRENLFQALSHTSSAGSQRMCCQRERRIDPPATVLHGGPGTTCLQHGLLAALIWRRIGSSVRFILENGHPAARDRMSTGSGFLILSRRRFCLFSPILGGDCWARSRGDDFKYQSSEWSWFASLENKINHRLMTKGRLIDWLDEITANMQ